MGLYIIFFERYTFIYITSQFHGLLTEQNKSETWNQQEHYSVMAGKEDKRKDKKASIKPTTTNCHC